MALELATLPAVTTPRHHPSTCWGGRWGRWSPPSGRATPRDGLAPGAVRRLGPRRDRRRGTGAHLLGCWRTGVWALTCSPTSSRPRRTPEPAAPWLSTSVRPPRQRRRSHCWGCLGATSTASGPRPAPTLVLHRRGDRAAPVAQGRALAATIPDAELVELAAARTSRPWAMPGRDRPGAALPGAPSAARAVPTSLTPRQTEVAALVAEGLTNRELSERLGITERSAESHVERIRLRLGFRSRSQVAAWYVAAGREVR